MALWEGATLPLLAAAPANDSTNNENQRRGIRPTNIECPQTVPTESAHRECLQRVSTESVCREGIYTESVCKECLHRGCLQRTRARLGGVCAESVYGECLQRVSQFAEGVHREHLCRECLHRECPCRAHLQRASDLRLDFHPMILDLIGVDCLFPT